MEDKQKWISKDFIYKNVYRRDRGRGFTLMEVLVSLAIISLVFVIILQIFSQGLSNIRSYKEYNRNLIEEKRVMGYIWYVHSPEMLRKYGLRARETEIKNLYIVYGENIQGEIYRFFAP